MRTTIIALTAAAGLVLVSGCGSLEEAANTADSVSQTLSTAQVCLRAVDAVDFTLDPETGVQQSQEAASTLSDLAGKAADTTVNEAIDALVGTLTSLTADDLTAPLDWVERKTDQATALISACTGA